MTQQLLEDGNVKVIIDSTHGGRIQQLYFHDTPLFYIPDQLKPNSWVNYGGDFLWVAPQHKWGGWPPVKEFDSLAWDVSYSGKKVIITSKEWNGIVLERSFLLNGGCLIVENSALNKSKVDVEWGLWNISQLSLVDLLVSFNVDKLKVFDFPNNVSEELLLADGNLIKSGDKYTVYPKNGMDFKVGGMANNNKISCKIGDIILEKEIFLSEKQQKTEFPHECNIEVYKNDNYLEAELVWPLVVLAPGEIYIGIQKYTVKKG